MKLTKYFMPFAALALLASCSNDKLDGPAENGGVDPNGESLFVNMRISQSLSTRTATPEQGIEVGKEEETKIGSVLLIFTPTDSHVVKAAAVTGTDANTKFETSGTNGQYAASFTVLKNQLKAGDYHLYVVANPTEAMTNLYIANTGGLTSKADASMQDIFTLASDGNTYWTDGKFVMSSAAEPATVSITAADLANGAHATQADALDLGEVTVQRVMSRFDIAANDLTFTVANGKLKLEGAAANPEAELSGLRIEIDAASLVNQAKTANIFKVGGTAAARSNWSVTSTTEGTTWWYFMPENEANKNYYVYSPEQTSFINPLFDAITDGSQVNLGTELEYTLITSANADNTQYTAPTDAPTGSTNINYFIWKYCMENTIEPAAGTEDVDKNQKKGITTAIVFRAKLSGGLFEKANGEPVYAYGNTLIGDENNWSKYQYDPSYEGSMTASDINEIIAIRYHQAEKDVEEGTYDDLDEALVANGFTIYKADDVTTESGTTKVYHSYYVYYNRHNDNNNDSLMGPMEFATVRNNVYKLWINTIKSLGHPGDPGDDPDPEDPDDPDESTEFWCEMAVKVLPWEVRINEINF